MRSGKHRPRYQCQHAAPDSLLHGPGQALACHSSSLLPLNITSLLPAVPSQVAPQHRCPASLSPGADRGARRWHRLRHRVCDCRSCTPGYWCKRLQGRERTEDRRNGSMPSAVGGAGQRGSICVVSSAAPRLDSSAHC